MDRRFLLVQAKVFLIDIWDKIIVFFNSYQWQEILFWLKMVSIVLCILMVLAMFIILIKKSTL
jgi:hypothetical protein